MMIKDIFKYGFFTGSRIIGGYSGNSDYDFVFPSTEHKEVYAAIHDNATVKGEEQSHYFNGTKYEIPNKDKTGMTQLNIIPVSKKDFVCWFLATVALEASYPYLTGADKETRCQVFEGLRASFKPHVTGEDKLIPKLIKKANLRWSDTIDEFCEKVK